NQCVAVDGEQQSDLDAFAEDLTRAAAKGKKFLFRSAASLLTALANLPAQPTASDEMGHIVRSPLGAVIVGSHVKKTTQQLQALLKVPNTVGVEIDVNLIRDNPDVSAQYLLQEVLEQSRTIHADGKTPVIYTSRQELMFAETTARLAFGEAVSALLIDIVKGLPSDLGFLISKGGITSNDTLSKGLALTSVRLLGQVIPGVSVVITAADHPQFPNLPVVLFPGNVGDDDGLAIAYQRLAA
ncbi:MAG: nucleotide-binding domain containing protein, partial [Cyanobacteria bacterium J06555_13]